MAFAQHYRLNGANVVLFQIGQGLSAMSPTGITNLYRGRILAPKCVPMLPLVCLRRCVARPSEPELLTLRYRVIPCFYALSVSSL